MNLTRIALLILLGSYGWAGDVKSKKPVSKPVITAIKKPNGEKVGEIRQKKGYQEAYAPNGKLLGTYDERRNETKLPNGRVVSEGNSLSSLIWKR